MGRDVCGSLWRLKRDGGAKLAIILWEGLRAVGGGR